MATMNKVIQQLRRVVLASGAEGGSDGELLGQFVKGRDEAAFEVLLRRHGPMVLGVCRRVLGNAHDAEDAFQATFLVLARRAASIRQRERLGNWLYGVAYRTALEARAKVVRRRLKESHGAIMPRPATKPDIVGPEFQALLDQELSRLADKYRLPLVLCELEGRPRKEVARQLQIPEGTLSSRLATAKRLLAKRLSRRGLALPASALAAFLSEGAASASVPSSLVISTVKAAAVVAAGQAALGSFLSVSVATLTERVLTAMFLTRLKIASFVVLLLVGITAIGAGLFSYPASGAEPAARQTPQPAIKLKLPPKAAPDIDKRLAEVEKQLRLLVAEVNKLRQELKGKQLPNRVQDKSQAQDAGKIFRLKNAKSADAAKIIEKLFSDKKGLALRVVADARTNSVIVFGTPKVLDEVAAVLQNLDTPAKK